MGAEVGEQASRHQAASAARLEAILRNARALMLKHGYAKTSLNEIMRLSGGSKSTITKHFGNKAGLFRAVFARFSRQLFEVNPFDAVDDRPWREQLQEMAEKILGLYVRPEALAVYRGVVGEGDPELAAGFYFVGHRLFVATVAEHFRQWQAAGLIVSADPEADADRFVHIIRAGLYEQALIGLAASPTPAQIRASAAASSALFARAIERR
jgi:AcrR family transcriptional regulator